MEIKKINLQDKSQPLTLSEILEGRIVVSPGIVKYHREGLINLVSLIASYQMTVRKDMSIDLRNDLLFRIGRNELPLSNIIRSYIACQLEVVDEVLKDSLDSLIESNHSKKINIRLKNSIVIFALDIIENIQLIRMAEFGYYCLNEACLNMFKNVSQDDFNRFQRDIKTIRDQSLIDKIDVQIFESSKVSNLNIDDISYRFLLRLFACSHNKKKVNNYVAYVYGMDTIKHINYFIGQWKNLSQTVELIVNRRGLNKRQDRGLKM